MARITTNTQATKPVVEIVLEGDDFTTDGPITVPALQDVTINNSTGIFSYTTFDDIDNRKLTTPGDNTVSTNLVIDDVVWFGDNTATSGDADFIGLFEISKQKLKVDFRIYLSGTETGARYITGSGYITSLAPTSSADSPIWVSPVEIAVDGSFSVATVS